MFVDPSGYATEAEMAAALNAIIMRTFGIIFSTFVRVGWTSIRDLPESIKMLGAIIYAEAADMSYDAKLVVGWVTRNRVKSSKFSNNTYADIISQDKQYYAYNTSMYKNALSYYESGSWSNSIQKDSMKECILVAINVYFGSIADITGGALYFHELSSAEKWEHHNEYTLLGKIGGFWVYK